MSLLFGAPRTAKLADLEGVEDPEALKALIDGASQQRIQTAVVKADTRGSGVARSTSAVALDAEQAQQALEKQQQALEKQQRSRTGAGAPSTGGGSAPVASSSSSTGDGGIPHWVLTTMYGLTNLSSVVMIVVANKMVLFTHKFSFAVTLTCLHALFTAVGMTTLAAAGVFEHKHVPWTRTAPIAAVYVGFVVLNNLSIQLNPLGAP